MAPRRYRLLAGFAAATLGALGAVALPARPAMASGCAVGVQGVTVVVDFASLAGGVVVGCAPGDPASGYDALHAAGFDTTGTVHDGPAFVCRINGKPDNSREQCVQTPPAGAYWSYWHAQPGGSWSYSQLGAMSYNPAPGSVEGWAFGAGATPSVVPVLVPPPPPPANPPPPPPGNPAPANPPPGTTVAPRNPGPSASGAATPPVVPSASDAPSGGTDTPGAATSAPLPSAAASTTAPAGRASRDGSGGPGGVLVAAGFVLVLGTGAGILSWRRRRPG